MHKLKLHVAVTSGYSDRGAIGMKQIYYCTTPNCSGYAVITNIFLHRLGYTPYAIRHTISANKLKYGKQTEIRQASSNSKLIRLRKSECPII